MSDGIRSHKLVPQLIAALLVAGPVQAQIVTDGSVGPKVSLRGGEIEIGANLGTRRGDNLFHSFEKFGIATGQSATFTGPGAIKNVISRVTGGEVSSIDGKLLDAAKNEGVAEGRMILRFIASSRIARGKSLFEKSFSLLAKIVCQFADEFR
jgi:large exoprotein involved in heme utilization and adhesion